MGRRIGVLRVDDGLLSPIVLGGPGLESMVRNDLTKKETGMSKLAKAIRAGDGRAKTAAS